MLYGKVRLTNYYKFSWLVLDWVILSSHQRRLLCRARLSDDSIYYSHSKQKKKKHAPALQTASPRCKAHSFTSVQERGTVMYECFKQGQSLQTRKDWEWEREKKRASDKLPQQSKNTAMKEHTDMMFSSSSNKFHIENAQLQLIWFLHITVYKGPSCIFGHRCRPLTQKTIFIKL